MFSTHHTRGIYPNYFVHFWPSFLSSFSSTDCPGSIHCFRSQQKCVMKVVGPRTCPIKSGRFRGDLIKRDSFTQHPSRVGCFVLVQGAPNLKIKTIHKKMEIAHTENVECQTIFYRLCVKKCAYFYGSTSLAY